MSFSGIEHKLRVFISSKCGGKYTVARKSLKKLLDVTGLVETYVFETEPASSEDTQSAYLEYIDASNLCIFLVDNEDGVSPAVLSEEKRAKDKHLRLLYIFCDESKKEPTPMQEEIKESLSRKYVIVHEFSDIVIKAYDSVMQDVIAVYKRNDTQFAADNNESVSSSGQSLNTEAHTLLTDSFSEFPHITSVLTKSIFQRASLGKEDAESPLESLLANHLQTVLFQKPFDKKTIDRICDEMAGKASGEICEVLKLRFQAQKCYYLTNYDRCIAFLQQAISIAMNAKSIPIWFANDIAIDIRHLQGRIDARQNRVTLENPGQKLIDASSEPVYFPYLDRQIENMQEEIAKKYYSQLNISPYTTSFGGLENLFSPLANAFCIAEIHGSIVQTEITRDRLISIYSMLCTLYEDHDLIVEYIKYLVMNRDAKKLDVTIRTYKQSIEILNGQDIDAIIDCINNIFDPIDLTMSKFLLASRLGYYMNDATYSTHYNELVEYALKWVREDTRVVNFSSYIFDFFRENTHRANSKDIVAFVCEVFSRKLARFYSDCFKVLQRIDFSIVALEDQARIKSVFIEFTKYNNKQSFDQHYSSALLRFCKTTALAYNDLESVLEEKHPVFFEKTFLLEMMVKREQDPFKYINLYLEEAKSRNNNQGMGGVFSVYAYESLDVICNILKMSNAALSSELLKNIVDTVLQTLSSETQTVSAKRTAIVLLQLVYFKTREQNDIWAEARKQLLSNASTYSVGVVNPLSKETNSILAFQYNLFVHNSFEQQRTVLLDTLFSTEMSEPYTIVQFLRIIVENLEITKELPVDETLVSAFLYYSIFMSQHKEQDVRYYAAKCLVELTRPVTTRRLALIHLSQIMNAGSETAKIAILTRLGQIQISGDDSYLKQILNKGKSDSSYLVRKIAIQASCK